MLGKFLDQLADKLIVTAVLVFMVALGRVPAWVVVVLIARDLAINGLRSVASAQGLVIAASDGGKIKTALQLVAIMSAGSSTSAIRRSARASPSTTTASASSCCTSRRSSRWSRARSISRSSTRPSCASRARRRDRASTRPLSLRRRPRGGRPARRGRSGCRHQGPTRSRSLAISWARRLTTSCAATRSRRSRTRGPRGARAGAKGERASRGRPRRRRVAVLRSRASVDGLARARARRRRADAGSFRALEFHFHDSRRRVGVPRRRPGDDLRPRRSGRTTPARAPRREA